MPRRLVDYDVVRKPDTVIFRSLYVSEDERYVAVVQLLLHEAPETLYVGVNISFYEAVVDDGFIDVGKRLAMRSFFVPVVKKTDPEFVDTLTKKLFEIVDNALECRLRSNDTGMPLPDYDDDLPIFVRVFYDFVLTRSFTEVHRS